MRNTSRTSWFEGVLLVMPVLAPVLPFGLVLGFSIAQSPLDHVMAWSSSWLVFAGAAQLATVELLGAGGSAFAILGTVVAVNARHMLYSAALNTKYDALPFWFRAVGSYVLIDQLFAIVEPLPDDIDRSRLIRIWLGAGSALWFGWQVSVAIGIWVGDLFPTGWSLEFIVPLFFGGLMLLSIRNTAGVVAALIGGLVAVLGSGLPPGFGLVGGILAGVTAGVVAEYVVGEQHA